MPHAREEGWLRERFLPRPSRPRQTEHHTPAAPPPPADAGFGSAGERGSDAPSRPGLLLGVTPFAILENMKQLALILCVALASGTVQAQKVYKVIRPDGTVEFTDSPPADEPTEVVDVPPINTTPPLASPRDASDDTTGAASEQGYGEFRITSPGNDEAIRDNAGTVKVDLRLEPSLRSGDRIDILLNGQRVGGGRSTAITLTNMDRGTHSIQAVVKNSGGKVVARSNTVTFTLQRRSAILQPAPPRPGPVPQGGGGSG